MVPVPVKATPAAVSRVATEDRDLPRQGSLVDGEGIKIVIHDVDSEVGECRQKKILLCTFISSRTFHSISSIAASHKP